MNKTVEHSEFYEGEIEKCGEFLEKQYSSMCAIHSISNAFGLCIPYKNLLNLMKRIPSTKREAKVLETLPTELFLKAIVKEGFNDDFLTGILNIFDINADVLYIKHQIKDINSLDEKKLGSFILGINAGKSWFGLLKRLFRDRVRSPDGDGFDYVNWAIGKLKYDKSEYPHYIGVQKTDKNTWCLKDFRRVLHS